MQETDCTTLKRMMTKGYIFDYGGTLDTAGCHWGKMLWHAYQRQQVPVTEDLFRNAYVYAERMLGKHPIIQSDYSFLRTLDVKLRIEFEYLQEKGYLCTGEFNMARMRSAVRDDLYQCVTETTKHSREVLERLKTDVPLVLVSNFYGNMPVVLEEFRLDGLFTAVVESAVVGIRKPDPRIFTLGVEALGMHPDEVTVVGDSIAKDMIPARKAGCRTVWMKGEGWTDDPVDENVADCIITDLAELVQR